MGESSQSAQSRRGEVYLHVLYILTGSTSRKSTQERLLLAPETQPGPVHDLCVFLVHSVGTTYSNCGHLMIAG